MDTHHLKADFGKHKGELYTRIPVSYLNWMVNSDHSRKNIAEAELKRRGTTMPDLDISGHAIDRASLRCRRLWHEDRGKDEGLHSWLHRVCGEVMKLVDSDLLTSDEEECTFSVEYKHMKLVFQRGHYYPTLKTVINKEPPLVKEAEVEVKSML